MGNQYKTIGMKNYQGLKDFMTGQLYPAILGSIIYIVYDKINELVSNPQKGLLLLCSLMFFYCDFYYIKHTKIYRWWFFLLDVGFLLLLVLAIKSINAESNSAISVHDIIFYYVIFLDLYLFWDSRELINIYNNKAPKSQLFKISVRNEILFYICEISWEFISIVLLIVLYFVLPDSDFALIVSLFTVTLLFLVLSFWKWKLYEQ